MGCYGLLTGEGVQDACGLGAFLVHGGGPPALGADEVGSLVERAASHGAPGMKTLAEGYRTWRQRRSRLRLLVLLVLLIDEVCWAMVGLGRHVVWEDLGCRLVGVMIVRMALGRLLVVELGAIRGSCLEF